MPKKTASSITRLQSIVIVVIFFSIIMTIVQAMITYSTDNRPSTTLFENSQTSVLINDIY